MNTTWTDHSTIHFPIVYCLHLPQFFLMPQHTTFKALLNVQSNQSNSTKLWTAPSLPTQVSFPSFQILLTALPCSVYWLSPITQHALSNSSHFLFEMLYLSITLKTKQEKELQYNCWLIYTLDYISLCPFINKWLFKPNQGFQLKHTQFGGWRDGSVDN